MSQDHPGSREGERPAPDPQPPSNSAAQEDPAPPQDSGGKKGLCGCLGCLGGIILVIIVVPILLIAGGWLMLPWLVSPADTEWVMVAPDTQRAEAVREAIQEDLMRLEAGERATITLSAADLNQLLAYTVAERYGELTAEDAADFEMPQLRFRIQDDVLYLDARIVIPEGTSDVPSRLQGQPVGMQLGLAPRAVGNAIALRVQDVRMGRIPLPVEMAMSLLAGTQAGAEVPFLDPDTGELRFSLAQLGPVAEGMTLHGLTVRDGALHVEGSR